MSMEQEPITPPAQVADMGGDRGAVPGQTRTASTRIKLALGMGAIVLVVIAGAAGMAKILSSSPTKKPNPAAVPDPAAGAPLLRDKTPDTTLLASMQTVQAINEEQKQAEQQKQAQAAAAAAPPPTAPIPVPALQNTGGMSAAQSQQKPVLTPFQRKLSGNVTIQLASSRQAPSEEHETNAINDELKGGFYADGRASVRDDLDFLLIHGTTIPCVLKTKIVTDYKGLVICQISKDVYAADGRVLLLDSGSNVFGEQKVALTQGKARVFINWYEVETPEGVRVRIDSLGTDAQGASGVDAWVDTHFAARFGGAIMLSFLDDVFQAVANSASRNNVTFSNTSNTTSEMANKALDNTINIPPTAYVNPGTVLTVLMARDVDMRSVYKLARKQVKP